MYQGTLTTVWQDRLEEAYRFDEHKFGDDLNDHSTQEAQIMQLIDTLRTKMAYGHEGVHIGKFDALLAKSECSNKKAPI